jgi:hypothetical protein
MAITSAQGASAGTDASMLGLTKEIAAAPPMAEASELTIVTPICTVAKNRSGSFLRRPIIKAHLTPFSIIVSIRLLRIAIMAISEAAKNPLARIKRKMTAASKKRFSTIINISPPCLQLEDNGKHVRREYHREATFWNG